jgi:capsular exopolysaccharide synthesis family protein
MEKEQGQPGTSLFPQLAQLLNNSTVEPTEADGVASVTVKASPSARLVALAEPRSLGAEKFRALVTRLENLRRRKEMKSLQVTSGAINEGKTLVATNLALTFASHCRSKVLLLEGDLHRPNMARLLGLNDLRGLSDWWSQQEQDMTAYLYRLNEMPLWLLSAGARHEQPSQILQSIRFVEAFHRLTGWFDWIIVDSTPMLPIVDVNLWSRLVDGSLLVVREGTASVKALEKGIRSVDNFKLVGIVLNEASEDRRAGYEGQYYGVDRNIRNENREKPESTP